MFNWISNIGDVTHAVQLALTPAFLLTGVAGILSVMATRLARIIDRGRFLTEPAQKDNLSDQTRLELHSLERRRHAASAAITMCVISALLVCSVVSVLFLEALLELKLKWLIGSLFMGSTIALVIGLAFFLHEVHIATRTIRILVQPIQQKEDS